MQGASAPQAPADRRLAERYGPVRDARRGRRTMWILAVTVAVLAGAFGLWVATDRLAPSVSTQEISFFVAPDQASVEVLFEITMPPGEQADCTIEALDANFGQVGLLDTRLGPFQDRVNQVRVPVATSAAPVTGIVRSCELVN
ncbi:DUF4307 domain-containing protein [Pseudactinotalea sp. Z1739]|uniref:DUF4307 domain-containing protein n=1 Tax=Pseudactinotalea sp. Z1739 TaxID=3413028 RepID=UPI003C7D7E5A